MKPKLIRKKKKLAGFAATLVPWTSEEDEILGAARATALELKLDWPKTVPIFREISYCAGGWRAGSARAPCESSSMHPGTPR